MQRWLARLRHDLIKQAAWRARDLRDLGDLRQPPRPTDLDALRRGLLELRDGEGRPVTATDLWRAFRAELPPNTDTGHAAALDAFADAVASAEAAVRDLPARPGGWSAALASVLQLERAFDELARVLTPRTPRT